MLFSRFSIFLLTFFISFALAPITLVADTAKGRITSKSNKAKIIQITAGKQRLAIHFNKSTKFVNAKSVKELGTNDLIIVEFQPGKPATKITKKVIELPKAWEISTKQVAKLVNNPKAVIIDARPLKRFKQGHIPGSVSIFADDLAKNPALLKFPKSKMLVFYCGGPTCGLSPKSAKIAKAQGFKKIKAYRGGMPGWKKAGMLVEVMASDLALKPHMVILDVKENKINSHIPGAVSVSVRKVAQEGKKYAAKKKPYGKRHLPFLKDKKAPIVIVGDTFDSPLAVALYKDLRKVYKYKSIALLAGGYNGWLKAGMPTKTGPMTTKITYVKKVVPGAVSPDYFMQLAKAKNGVILDVRDNKEAKKGMIKGAIHIPLDRLEASLAKLPKNKPVVAHCASGVRAEMAFNLLKNKGFKKAGFLNNNIAINKKGVFKID